MAETNEEQLKRKKDYDKLLSTRYSLLPHRSTYLLPFVYNWMPHENIYQSIKTVDPKNANKDYYKNQEAEFQISFAIPVWRKIAKSRWDLMFAYTHHAWWQIYNSAWSRPFRETNYTPEIFARYIYGEPKKVFGFDVEAVDIGYMHQSNGQIQGLSRSWNRLYVRSLLKNDYISFLLTAWYRVPEERDDDDNRDIYNYMGFGDIEIFKKFGNHAIHYRTPILSHHFSSDLKYSYPWREGLRWYLSYQSGYGQSLIEYNRQTQRLGIGFVLENLLND